MVVGFRSRAHAALALALAAAVAGGVLAVVVPNAQAAGATIYVSPKGSGNGTSASSALGSIQAALNVAKPGTTIVLATGEYNENPVTKRAGSKTAPIKIKGPERGTTREQRYKATLYGDSRVFSVNHSYIQLEGFTIDGAPQLKGTKFPTSLAEARKFKDSVQSKVQDSKLVYIGAGETSKNITGVVLNNMFLSTSGGECVRMRNNAQRNLVVNSIIQWCGMYGKGDGSKQYKYHNAEGVYIGTSPKSTDQPMAANDTSSNNVVRSSTIDTFGSECLNVKENAHHNVLEKTVCRNNDEPAEFKGSLVELRGDHNIIRGNVISRSASDGIKLKSDSAQYDKGGNTLQNNMFTAIEGKPIASEAKSVSLCGNKLDRKAVEGQTKVCSKTQKS